MKSTSVYLPSELIEKIKAAHLNTSSLVRDLLVQYFKQREEDVKRVG